jgi:hypothetical protein
VADNAFTITGVAYAVLGLRQLASIVSSTWLTFQAA